MITLFYALLVLISVTVSGRLAPGLRVKYDAVGIPGVTRYYEVPRTVAEARAAGWILTAQPRGPLPQLAMYCYPDKVVCALMDDTGYIAGLQAGIRMDKVSNNVFSWRKRGFTCWKTKVNGKITWFWILRQYYVSQNTLRKCKRERIETRDSSRIIQEGAIWFTGIYGRLLKVSTSEDVIKRSIFTRQGCLAQMGQHYFYNLSESTQPVSEQIYPWFVVTYEKEVVCSALLTLAELDVDVRERDWFEHPNSTIIKLIAPYAPKWVYNLPAISMHIYLVDDPFAITC